VASADPWGARKEQQDSRINRSAAWNCHAGVRKTCTFSDLDRISIRHYRLLPTSTRLSIGNVSALLVS
jgi:hypothetical protein